MSQVLKDFLAEHTMPADDALAKTQSDAVVECCACAHRCRIPVGQHGICHVRRNIDGQLRVPAGYVAGLAADPIEKKPFFHVMPGAEALSFGMLGCNFHCSFCQNWVSSQTLRDENAVTQPSPIDADRLVALGKQESTPIVVSTYNEPLITAEWSRTIFERATEAGMMCGFVSNGHATRECLEFLQPMLKICNVDLKCFTEKGYRELGGKLKGVLETIETLKEMGVWVEVVTLVVPEFNTEPGGLEGIAKFIAGVSPDIPWHVTAFRPAYRSNQAASTPAEALKRAYDVGHEAGLKFVYTGNLRGAHDSGEDTLCPGCRSVLVKRRGFSLMENRIRNGKCPDCREDIPGVWEVPRQ